MSNGHIHVWRMHKERSPTLISVWDKLTPNHKDLALSMTMMPRGQLDPLLAEIQGWKLLEPSAHAVLCAYAVLFSVNDAGCNMPVVVDVRLLYILLVIILSPHSFDTSTNSCAHGSFEEMHINICHVSESQHTCLSACMLHASLDVCTVPVHGMHAACRADYD